MHARSRLFWSLVAVLGAFALSIPAVAAAREESPPPPNSMESPLAIQVDGPPRKETFEIKSEEAIDGKYGIEEGEPVTLASRSVCRGAGFVDPVASTDDEEGPGWALRWTNWYSFTGTGRPVVVRLLKTSPFGLVVYRTNGTPTVADGLACAGGISKRLPRVEIGTEAGQRYLVQVGDSLYYGDVFLGFKYALSIGAAVSNFERSNAIELPFGTTVQMSNFGGGIESPPPTCPTAAGAYIGGRGVWGKVVVPSVGTLHVTLASKDDLEAPTMIGLYPAGSPTPVACSTGPADGRTTEMDAPVSPGGYRLRLMSAVKGDESPLESAEEHWRVTASFAPNLDLDGDGHARPSDCDDENPAVHPGAAEVPDNGIDENCDGQDARRDSDGDGVPDYKDQCPARSSKGIDTNSDGCRDPEQLKLAAQVNFRFKAEELHLTSLSVRTTPGARVSLSCEREVCSGESKLVPGERGQFRRSFKQWIPSGADITLTASKRGYVSAIKRFQLSTEGIRLLRQWCVPPDSGGKKAPCA